MSPMQTSLGRQQSHTLNPPFAYLKIVFPRRVLIWPGVGSASYFMWGESMQPNELILWEYQKKRICQFYECSDSHDRQYPDCEGVKFCRLLCFMRLVEYLNKDAWPHEIEMQREVRNGWEINLCNLQTITFLQWLIWIWERLELWIMPYRRRGKA